LYSVVLPIGIAVWLILYNPRGTEITLIWPLFVLSLSIAPPSTTGNEPVPVIGFGNIR